MLHDIVRPRIKNVIFFQTPQGKLLLFDGHTRSK